MSPSSVSCGLCGIDVDTEESESMHPSTESVSDCFAATFIVVRSESLLAESDVPLYIAGAVMSSFDAELLVLSSSATGLQIYNELRTSCAQLLIC